MTEANMGSNTHVKFYSRLCLFTLILTSFAVLLDTKQFGDLRNIDRVTFVIFPLRPSYYGTTEKARTENAAPSKMQGWKTRERKTRHQSAGVEKARKCIYSIDI